MFQRVLIGTSSSRSSSSGACSDRASVTGMPSVASCCIRGTRPTVETVIPRALMPSPSGVGADQLADGSDDRLVVGHRLAHAHEHDVADPASPSISPRRSRRAPSTTCSTISAVTHVALQTTLPGRTERAGHPAAGLTGHAHRDPVGIAHQHALDQGVVEQPPQGLDRVTAGQRSGCGPAAAARGMKAAASDARTAVGQVGPLLRIGPQALEVVTRQLPGPEGAMTGGLDVLAPLRGSEVGPVPRRLPSSR